MTEVRAGSHHRVYTTDPTTGKYYEKSTYSFVNSLTEYANKSDFESGISSGTVAVAPSTLGPYITVNNGNLYSRNSSSSVSSIVQNLASNTITATSAQIGTIGGANHGFDWGGYSNGNFLQDETGVYFLGSTTSSSSSIWEIHKVDANLNSVASQTFDVSAVTGSASDPRPGFAVMMGGKLLLGQTYHEDLVTGTLDFATGNLTTTTFEVDGNWSGSSYWNSTFYNSNTDTLYMNNTNVSKLYKIENAKSEFGIAAIPEPGTVAFIGLGLAGLGFARRKRAA